MLPVRLRTGRVIVLSGQQPEDEVLNADADGAYDITAAASEGQR